MARKDRVPVTAPHKLGVVALALLGAQCRDRPPEDIRSFFSLSMAEQGESLRTYDLERQVRIYMWGMTQVGPPMNHLAGPLAANGEAVVPYLMTELTRATHPQSAFSVVYAFERMACDGIEVSEKEDVVARLNRAIAQMASGYWRDRASESLDILRGRSSCVLSEEELRRRVGREQGR